MIFVAIGSVLGLMWLVCHIIVLIHAFKTGVVEGLLYLCIPCYALYYLFFRFEHANKTLLVLCYLFGGVAGSSLTGYGYQSMGMGYRGDHPAHHR
jgi:hypothetical protein